MHPPVHHLVASYLAYKSPATEVPKSAENFMSDFSNVVPIRAGGPRLDTGAWDARAQTVETPSNG